MPLFTIAENQLCAVERHNFRLEKDLQTLIENNLRTVFNCRFIASEFATGSLHAGRIDSLALSEDDNPVIIEYKKVESSELINQSLYYLHWVQDHKGDFEIAVQKRLGNGVKVDWSNIRVICIAPNYKKYDIHAVQVMNANIELWRYRLYKNQSLFLEEVFHNVKDTQGENEVAKNPVMVEAGKKAALARANNTYTFAEHLENKPGDIQSLMHAVREYMTTLDSSIEEVAKKYYIAYRTSQNIVCMEPLKRTIKLYVKLRPSEVHHPPRYYRDVTNIGHSGTGNSEFTLSSEAQLEETKPFIELAYNKVGS